MKEIIDNVGGIFGIYKIPFHENDLNKYSRGKLLLEASGTSKLREIFKKKYHKDIDVRDAKELEILLLTYQYISDN